MLIIKQVQKWEEVGLAELLKHQDVNKMGGY